MCGEALTLGMKDSGRQVSVKQGGRIVLRLPENPTTGCRWAGDLPEGLEVAGDTNDAGTAPGASGERAVEFIAAKLGRIHLQLRRAQTWEPATASDPVFRLIIDVE